MFATEIYEYWKEQLIECMTIICGSWILSGGLILLFLVVAFIYVGLPVYFYFTYRLAASLSYDVLDKESRSKHIDEAREYFYRYEFDLNASGFKQQIEFVLNDSSNETTTYGQLWWNQHEKVQVCLSVIYCKNSDEFVYTTKNFEFSSSFKNGATLDTSNTINSDVFSTSPKHIIAVLSGELDIIRVFGAHKAFISDYTKRSPLVDIFSGSQQQESDVLKQLSSDCEKEISVAIENGYYIYFNENELRLSFKAAFILVFQLLPPFKQFEKWKMKRRVQNKLNQLGVVID